jgi:SAM-dependent methyltransferase
VDHGGAGGRPGPQRGHGSRTGEALVEGRARPDADDHLKPKPSGLDRRYAEQFGDPSVVASYAARPPYPDRLLYLIVELAVVPRPRILDLGCGLGELARRLAPSVGAITAIDHAPAMIAAARALPGGTASNITWIDGRVEDVALGGPFACALAGESFHWFDWPVLVPRLAAAVPSARLILIDRRELGPPWADDLKALIERHSTNQEFERYDVVDELTSRRLFVSEGRLLHRRQIVGQSIADYVTSLHSRNGLSRDRMPADSARAFDDGVRAIVALHAVDGLLQVPIETRVVWGRVTGC